MKFFASWKTTLFGIVGGLVVCLQQLLCVLDSDPNTVFSVQTFLMGLGMLGIGAFARDNNVTSEKAGLK